MKFKLINDIEIEAAQFWDDTENIMQIVNMFPNTDITVSYLNPYKPKLRQDNGFELNFFDWIVKYKLPWSENYNVKTFTDDEFKKYFKELIKGEI